MRCPNCDAICYGTEVFGLFKCEACGIKFSEKIISSREENPGINPGAKHDTGKPKLSSVDRYFPLALAGVARVSEYGATLHGWSTWHTIENPIERYEDAIRRHQVAKASGEVYDKESGLKHSLHIVWCAMAIAQLEGE